MCGRVTLAFYQRMRAATAGSKPALLDAVVNSNARLGRSTDVPVAVRAFLDHRSLQPMSLLHNNCIIHIRLLDPKIDSATAGVAIFDHG